jgi:hypothetical protein
MLAWVRMEGKNPDSFLWYDELHPRYVNCPLRRRGSLLILIRHSEQTDRIIVKNFVNVLGREVQARDVLLLKVQKLYQRRTRRRQEQANIR